MLPPAAAGSSAPAPVLTLATVEAQSFCRLRPAALAREQLLAAQPMRQVDAKFIPVVCGGGILALVDQHAAHERVRLEHLRRELLGPLGLPAARPAPSLALTTPQPLGSLAGGEAHMLAAWAGSAEAWGWRWASAAASGPGDAGAPAVVVTHVPLVCGVALTATDLRLYLHQLEQTGGAGGPPPAITRVLNSKACRGAVMFGQELRPSQCAEVVEQLKETQLCFVCAHGRPTVAPLADLRALGRAVALRGGNGGGGGAAPLGGLKARLLLEMHAT
jgi:DNA mismatch repair protein MLH3